MELNMTTDLNVKSNTISLDAIVAQLVAALKHDPEDFRVRTIIGRTCPTNLDGDTAQKVVDAIAAGVPAGLSASVKGRIRKYFRTAWHIPVVERELAFEKEAGVAYTKSANTMIEDALRSIAEGGASVEDAIEHAKKDFRPLTRGEQADRKIMAALKVLTSEADHSTLLPDELVADLLAVYSKHKIA